MTWDNLKAPTIDAAPVKETVNQGLRTYMNKVYGYMAGGLALSGICAFVASQPPLVNLLYTISPKGVGLSGFGWILLIALFVMIFMFHSAVAKLNVRKAQGLFWGFCALMGVSLSNVVLIYSGESLMTTFLVTAGSFAGLSLYGYTTRRDLSGMGSFLMMGLFGLILVMIVNFFMKSPAVAYAMSLIGVFLFAGLTAWDSQRIRRLYMDTHSTEVRNVLAISGALALFLDFVNLFVFLIQFLGNSRE